MQDLAYLDIDMVIERKITVLYNALCLPHRESYWTMSIKNLPEDDKHDKRKCHCNSSEIRHYEPGMYTK